jgi:hypothetical protein
MTYLNQDLARAAIDARVVAAREQRLVHQVKRERRAARRLARQAEPSWWSRRLTRRGAVAATTPVNAATAAEPVVQVPDLPCEDLVA